MTPLREMVRKAEPELVQLTYNRLDIEKRREVARMVKEISETGSSCAYYGFDYGNLEPIRLYAAAMYELDLFKKDMKNS